MAENVTQQDVPEEDSSRPGSVMRKLGSAVLDRNIPLYAMLELTGRCNLWCRHCYITDRYPKGELTVDEYKGILDQLADEGTLFLTLTGGEPLTHPDFFEIASYARQKEFALVIFSNGTLITPEVADRLRELCPQRVEISILGGQAATHDRISQVEGSFDQALRGARLLIERGIKVQLKSTWMRENIDEHEQVLALAEDMGASFRGGTLIIHRRDGSKETTDLLASEAQLRAMAQRSYERNPDGQVPPEPVILSEEQKLHVHPCGTGQISCRIDAYGYVYPCAAIEMKLGSLREQTFAAIWGGAEDLQRVRDIRVSDLAECSSCELFTRCNRCPGQVLMETGSLLAASQQACMVAHAFEQFYHEKRCELH